MVTLSEALKQYMEEDWKAALKILEEQKQEKAENDSWESKLYYKLLDSGEIDLISIITSCVGVLYYYADKHEEDFYEDLHRPNLTQYREDVLRAMDVEDPIEDDQ